MNTNFAAALKMILDAIISQKLKPEDVEDMVLVIFSDMQMDQADKASMCLMETIEKQYADAGIRIWGKPFNTPHILFWNLRSTSGFPTLSNQTNCSMMSGFSPSLLNVFCEEGLSALQSCTPWSLLVKSLNNERYDILDKYIRENI
jgi:ABC-type amino acid transport substrate-binding protein